MTIICALQYLYPTLNKKAAQKQTPVTLKVATGIMRATDQLYQTISKFHHKQSYGPETNPRWPCVVVY